eukprot:CAMPEP_0117450750 /NCGR_PEP_ID=MMETSP0759-20121206/8636_1 /TAXON_ID=63605 /ORGANISM="Percolomonas cosmopolitus, Strain WS" /LENGTH=963 /DNA_ID=CAMNT_0005243295 /DNA_START=289 /DNA_END=3180 /DNA_ORIENTATION=-
MTLDEDIEYSSALSGKCWNDRHLKDGTSSYWSSSSRRGSQDLASPTQPNSSSTHLTNLQSSPTRISVVRTEQKSFPPSPHILKVQPPSQQSFRHSKPLGRAENNSQRSPSPNLLEAQSIRFNRSRVSPTPTGQSNDSTKKNIVRVSDRAHHNHAVLKLLRHAPSRVTSLSPNSKFMHTKSKSPVHHTSPPQDHSLSAHSPNDAPIQHTLIDRHLIDVIIKQHFQSPSPNLNSSQQSSVTQRKRRNKLRKPLLSKHIHADSPTCSPLSQNTTHMQHVSQLNSPLEYLEYSPSPTLPSQSMLPSALIAGDLSFIFNMPSYGPLIKFLFSEYEGIIEFLKEHKRHNCQPIPLLQEQLEIAQRKGDAQHSKLSEEFDEHLEQLRAENNQLRHQILINSNDEYVRELRYTYESLCMKKQEINSDIEREKVNAKHLYEAVKFSRDNEKQLREQIKEQENENMQVEKYRERYMNTLATLNTMPEVIHEDEHTTQLEQETNYRNQNRLLSQKLEQEQEFSKHLKQNIEKLKTMRSPETDHDGILSRERAEIKKTHSPRPDWSRIKKIHDSQEVRNILKRVHSFSDLDINLSSKEIVRRAAEYFQVCGTVEKDQSNEITSLEQIIALLDPSVHNKNTAQLNDIKEFYGFGTGPEVPKYLRISGSVRNKQLSKRELENLLDDIWKQRIRSLKAGSKKKPVSLGDFFETYLSTQFSNVLQVKREWAYSIVEGCKVYSEDPDCALFLKILNGEIAEEAYQGQDELLSKLRTLMEKLDQMMYGITTGKVKKRDVFRRLDKFFRTKSKHNLLIIKCMLHYQNPDPVIEYGKLFQDDRNHTQGIFVEVVRDQYLQEIIEYNSQLEESILSLADDLTNSITFKKIHEAFYHIDPLKTKAQVEELIQKGLMLTEPIKWKQHVDADQIINALHKILIVRSTPVDEVENAKRKIDKRKKDKEKKKLLVKGTGAQTSPPKGAG